MSDVVAQRTSSDIAGRVTLGLTMIDRGEGCHHP
jgi:hypothetical protein